MLLLQRHLAQARDQDVARRAAERRTVPPKSVAERPDAGRRAGIRAALRRPAAAGGEAGGPP